MTRLQDKFRAIDLRKRGLSYKEIQEQVSVSKGLLSRWFSYLELTPEEENHLKERMLIRKSRGRIDALIANRSRRIERERLAFKDAEVLFRERINDHIFLAGVILYWAEGSKRVSNFQFINSDPEMIFFMHKWIQKYLGIDKKEIRIRLFIHRIPGYENVEAFWAKNLVVEPDSFQKTIYKNTIHPVKKNPNYKGCLRLTVNKIYHLRLMKAWQKLFMKYHGEAFMHP